VIIVAGVLHVDPAERAAYLADCTAVVAQARSFPGCLDFALSPDLLDSGRINVYERWSSVRSCASSGARARTRPSRPPSWMPTSASIPSPHRPTDHDDLRADPRRR
jgi:quinol monooxygenase YgiN